MTDLLTHVLVAYVLAQVLVRLGHLDRRYVPVAMVGAVVPDVAKVYFLLGDPTTSVFGIGVSWYALQTVGGVAALAGVGTLAFGREERPQSAASIGLGAISHLVLDLLVVRAHGFSPPYFYPLTWWRPPSVDLYLSSDPWPSLVAVACAGTVWYLGRVRSESG